ncbi:hypothetical protein P153DRAFT_386908 [Dothidotthia symphoricarpi CBS 119687]|uniref:Uncharacterized protein n=1 Tax=Dothidotthia symphoricarpi CBS 119687 TaxID=1392245 RepID=A0A6A6A7X5_9PLEO|nr:uncharacterized protein P153DRAFT_386908 [Dothidotthia symphoricarpi CBS 119687]KAF2127930.1 hypothetical protein P153DRAFT_386908 [Dothidotthia symphoricarpi CBS 119687]
MAFPRKPFEDHNPYTTGQTNQPFTSNSIPNSSSTSSPNAPHRSTLYDPAGEQHMRPEWGANYKDLQAHAACDFCYRPCRHCRPDTSEEATTKQEEGDSTSPAAELEHKVMATGPAPSEDLNITKQREDYKHNSPSLGLHSETLRRPSPTRLHSTTPPATAPLLPDQQANSSPQVHELDVEKIWWSEFVSRYLHEKAQADPDGLTDDEKARYVAQLSLTIERNKKDKYDYANLFNQDERDLWDDKALPRDLIRRLHRYRTDLERLPLFDVTMEEDTETRIGDHPALQKYLDLIVDQLSDSEEDELGVDEYSDTHSDWGSLYTGEGKTET